jgi:pimeloyl-ACP methyl ester carboxylesterase
MSVTVKPYKIAVAQAQLDWIRAMVAGAKPLRAPKDDADWKYGLDVRWFAEFLEHWAKAYDWRAHEAALNLWSQVLVEIDGLAIHAFHIKGSASRPRPLLLTHGWPGSAYEFAAMVGPLTRPQDFGGDAEDGFDLVIPSLPGIGFSAAPDLPLGPRAIAGLWRRLMSEGLGYTRFGVQGGDLGSAVSTWLGCDADEQVAGVHLNLCVPPMSDPTDDPEELAWRQAYAAVQQRESAYMVQHATKPQTVAAALSASPVACAAWMLEKFHGWSDCGGDIERCFSKDQLITNLMFYLAEDKAGSAIWLYRGAAMERASGRFDGLKVEAPTAVAVFPGEFLPPPPQATAARYYRLERWTLMASGGHFAAMEQPTALADDIRAFFHGRL